MGLRTAGRMATAIAMGALLAGCDTLGNPLDVMSDKKPTPDEFKVVARAPLVVPPEARTRTSDLALLPAPRPGATSPREPDPNRAAAEALLGPGATTQPVSAGPSAGETVLLGAATAGANAQIRNQLDADAVAAAEAEAAGPYEPPTVLELIGLGDDEDTPEPGTVVDPIAESQRLQRQGIASPNDPTALPDPEAVESGS
ncbi:MAG: DUF3035 domain-containing protein [Pseudomonadota bacterium]